MLTYEEMVKKPRLEITFDDNNLSPRGDDGNLGYFLTKSSKYSSPDENEELHNIMVETGEVANDLERHIEMMTDKINKETDEQVVKIYSVSRYEHGVANYNLGSIKGFDYSNNSFYIITKKTQKEAFVKAKDFEKTIESELKIYSKYVNGEIYRFGLFDESGELQDSCGGFYEIEDMREELPKEFKDEDLNEYFIS